MNGTCYETRLQLEVNVVSLTEGEEPWIGTDRIFTIPCTDIAVHEVCVFWKGPKDFYSQSVRDWQNVKLGTSVDNTGYTEAL